MSAPIDLFAPIFEAMSEGATRFWFLLPLLAFAFVWKTRIFKGWFGEASANSYFNRKLDRRAYHLLHDVTLPMEGGGTTQIDHIIVSAFGLFVIETKNMKGWIFGSERQAT